MELYNAAFGSWDRRRHRPTLLHLAVSYDLIDNHTLEQAVLPVERIGAPILCLSGEEDEVWPSSRMSEAILARRAEREVAACDHHERYPRCGHLIRYPYGPTTGLWASGIAFGGTPEGLARAQADAWPRILRFFDRHLKARTNLEESTT